MKSFLKDRHFKESRKAKKEFYTFFIALCPSSQYFLRVYTTAERLKLNGMSYFEAEVECSISFQKNDKIINLTYRKFDVPGIRNGSLGIWINNIQSMRIRIRLLAFLTNNKD